MFWFLKKLLPEPPIKISIELINSYLNNNSINVTWLLKVESNKVIRVNSLNVGFYLRTSITWDSRISLSYNNCDEINLMENYIIKPWEFKTIQYERIAPNLLNKRKQNKIFLQAYINTSTEGIFKSNKIFLKNIK